MKGCPHCRMAREYMRQLCEEDPGYAQVPVNEIDENENAALAVTECIIGSADR